MKAIMKNIQPKWVVKILNGEKIIEVSTTAPKDWKDYLEGKTKTKPDPMDVYIYCTEDKNETLFKNNEPLGEEYYDYSCISKKGNCYEIFNNDKHTKLNGKIVAKFTLNKVEELTLDFDYTKEDGGWVFYTNNFELLDYCYGSCKNRIEGKKLYAWHIDNLEIFDKSKELREFYKYMDLAKRSEHMLCMFHKCNACKKCQLTKAPLTYCYVEVDE